jgi:hypothetical protein
VILAILEHANGPTISEIGVQVGFITTDFHVLNALDPMGRASNSIREAGCYQDALWRYTMDGKLKGELKFDKYNKETRSVVTPWFKLQDALIRRLNT